MSFDNLINARWRKDRREIMTVPIKARAIIADLEKNPRRYNWMRRAGIVLGLLIRMENDVLINI